MSPPNPRDQAFIDYLHKLADDRAALAALRRGLGKPPGAAAETYPYVVPFLPQGRGDAAEEPYYLVATLFAYWHQGDRPVSANPPPNLGASLAKLQKTEKRKAESADSAERRFVALLNCHRDDLGQHLRRMVGLLRSKDIPIDWAQLLADVKGWNWESRSVQRAWGRAFWRGAPVADSDQPASEPAPVAQ
jgi:CRISPR system Cascade subunit CasB